MKILLTSLNKKHNFNPVVDRLFSPLAEDFGFMYEWPESGTPNAVILSFIAPEPDFDLDTDTLAKLSEATIPIVVLDHTEVMPKGFALGFSELHRSSYYWPVHDWLAHGRHRIKAYFKRELSDPHHMPCGGTPVYALDWTVPSMPDFDSIDSRGSYANRPIDILMSWGYSSESRPRLYGELVKQAGRFSSHFCLDEADLKRALDEKRKNIFALIFTPWYRRLPLDTVMRWQSLSKITLSIKGAGLKCFRNGEASYNSLMAQQAPESVNWAYPWIAGTNCIGLPNDKDGEIDATQAVEVLFKSLRVEQGSLYDLYTKCILNNRNYHSESYSRDWLLPKLKEAFK